MSLGRDGGRGHNLVLELCQHQFLCCCKVVVVDVGLDTYSRFTYWFYGLWKYFRLLLLGYLANLRRRKRSTLLLEISKYFMKANLRDYGTVVLSCYYTYCNMDKVSLVEVKGQPATSSSFSWLYLCNR
ncbi:hypothetical protein K439DRAFT_1625404 [Ramaria rubella]|nr:hypothetical protein K439DRAFT_1625404 [Ramaria rubella]